MSFVLIAAIIIIVFLISIYKTVEVDITLKYYELFGKKVDELRGKVVWITGASSGIGENLAYELASVGCKLVLSARRKQELERVKTKCSEIAGKKLNDEDKEFLVLPLDVTKFDTHEQAFQTVLEHFGQIDILVNNSGRAQRGMIINTEFKVDQELFELNVLGTISLTKVVLPHMIERNAGHIVVVSSLNGKLGVPTSGTYSATKHALQGYFYALRTEVYDNGIDVSIVCPGPVKSAIVENSVSEKFGKSAKDTPYGKEDMSQRMETDQFVKYMAIAMVNKLGECWISPQPGLWVIYASQYMPSIFTWLYKRYVLRYIKKLRYNEEKKEN